MTAETAAFIALVGGLTIWSWIGLVIITFMCFLPVAWGNVYVGAPVMIASAIIAHLTGLVDFKALSSITAMDAAQFAAAWAFCGAVWCSFLVWRKARLARIDFNERYAEFIKSKLRDIAITDESRAMLEEGMIPDESRAMLEEGMIPDAMIPVWKQRLLDSDVVESAKTPQNVSAARFFFWPWDAIWYFLSKVIIDFSMWAIKRLSGFHTWIVRLQFRGIDPRLLTKDDK